MKKTTSHEAVVRGKPKSGRIWKEPKQRASSMKKGKRDTFQKKQLLREQLKKVKELSQHLRESKKAEIDEKRLRTALNKKRKEENSKKSEIVQVIKNTAKLKRMKKKQLRKIEKRDTTIVEKGPSLKKQSDKTTSDNLGQS